MQKQQNKEIKLINKYHPLTTDTGKLKSYNL